MRFTKIYQTFLKVLLSILIITGFSFSGFSSQDTIKYYVSTTGSDNNKGTADQPFATLQIAQSAIRNDKNKGIKAPVEVIIKGGVYYLNETLVLNPEDSGTSEAPVTWRAAENERVILSGGREIKGAWKKDGKIWYVDLPETKGWKRDINTPETWQKKPQGPWYFRQLLVEEKWAIRARFPNKNEPNPFLYAVDGSMEHVKLETGKVKSERGEDLTCPF